MFSNKYLDSAIGQSDDALRWESRDLMGRLLAEFQPNLSALSSGTLVSWNIRSQSKEDAGLGGGEGNQRYLR